MEEKALKQMLQAIPADMGSWSDEDLFTYRELCESQLKENPSNAPAQMFLKVVLQIIASRKQVSS
jgi:hypothetical protein